jgi:IS30 family transposase
MKTQEHNIMVGKWSCANPLTIEERRLIKEGLDLNMNYREISEHVGRCKSVVMREAKRLGDISEYDPDKAQAHFEKLQRDKNKRIK